MDNCKSSISDEKMSKKRKISEVESDPESSDALRDFAGFKITKILNINLKSKSVFLLGTFDGETGGCTEQQENPAPVPSGGEDDTTVVNTAEVEKQAVVLLEKTAFVEETLPSLMSAETSLTRNLQNDIYGTYECFPKRDLSGMKATVIYPATQKHIQKFSVQDVHLINESYQDYKNITLPYLEENQFNIQWVFNILEKKAETERIIFEDPDPETGFIMLPDMKWDQGQVQDLYLIVICHRRGIKSLRDLDASHLPLLRNIQEKCTNCIKEKYGIPEDKLRAYLHYQPSYYHLHVHFTHLQFDAPGTNVGRAHLLSSVIDNIDLVSDYYQRTSLTYVLRENDGLLKKFRAARIENSDTK